MFEKITKKEFLKLLEAKKNVLLYSNFNMSEEASVNVMNWLYNYDVEKIDVQSARFCVKKQSNAIKFNTGSWLYFNNIKKCYQHNNIIVSFEERYDDFDKKYVYDVMAYAII